MVPDGDAYDASSHPFAKTTDTTEQNSRSQHPFEILDEPTAALMSRHGNAQMSCWRPYSQDVCTSSLVENLISASISRLHLHDLSPCCTPAMALALETLPNALPALRVPLESEGVTRVTQHRVWRGAKGGEVAGAEAPLCWQINGGVQEAQSHLLKTPSSVAMLVAGVADAAWHYNAREGHLLTNR